MWQQLLNEEAQRFILQHEGANTAELALSAKKHQYPFPLIKAFEQIDCRKKAKAKLPNWYSKAGIIFPSRLALEQCSSEATASYKLNLISGNTLVDLTGGMGVDSAFFATKFQQVVHIEPNNVLSEITTHNFNQLEIANIRCINSTAESFLDRMDDTVDYFYIDPSRRDQQKKTFLLPETVPNVIELHNELLKKSKHGYILKASPLLDIKHGIQLLGTVDKVVVLAVNGEVKELLLFCGHAPNQNPRIEAVNISTSGNLTETFSFSLLDEMEATALMGQPSTFLYEPNAACMKAGAFNLVATRYGLTKLHQHSHLYTSVEYIKDFPGRVFQISVVVKPDKNTIQNYLSTDKANVAVRNFPSSAEDLKKKLGLKDGGYWYLFGTTLLDNVKVVIVARKVEHSSK